GLAHLTGQAVAGGLPLPRSGLAPALQRAVGRRAAGRPEARAVEQQPEGGKGGGILGLEDLREVGLDKGGAGQGGVVAQKPELPAVGNQAPERPLLLVEVVLQRE